jgi:hypothetical protein
MCSTSPARLQTGMHGANTILQRWYMQQFAAALGHFEIRAN